MAFFTRPHFEDRQFVQLSGESITLGGNTNLNSQARIVVGSTNLQDTTGTTTTGPITVSGLNGELSNLSRISGLVIEPPVLYLLDALDNVTGSTTVDVTGYVLTSYDSGGTATWDTVASLSADTNTYTIGGSLIGETVYFDTNATLSAYTTNLSGLTFVGGSGSCITDLYVTNVYGCSPITLMDDTIFSGNTTFTNPITMTTIPTLDSGLTQILGRDSTSGVLKYVDVNTIITSATTEDSYVTGLTINGNSLEVGRNQGLATLSVDLSTYLDNTDNYITGGTMVGNTLVLNRTDTLSAATIDLSSFLDDTNFYVTGGTVTGTDLILGRNGGLVDITIDTSSYFDNTDTNYYTTGLTLNGNSLEIGRNGGLSTLTTDLSSYLDNSDNFITGGTMVGNTLVLDRTNSLSAVTVDMSQFSDTFVTGFTYNNANLLTLGRNQGLSDLTTSIGTFTGVTVNGLISGSSISINGGEEMTRIPSTLDFQLFANQSSNGVIEFGGFSANTLDTSKFDIGVVRGWHIENTPDPLNPLTHYIDYSGSTGSNPSGVTLTYLATNPVTYIGMDDNNVIIQSQTPFTNTQDRTYLELGVIVHSDNTTVNAVNNHPIVGIDTTLQLYDLMLSIGIFNDNGNVYSANGSNLNINKSDGDVFAAGSNFTIDNTNPHIKETSADNGMTFRYRLQDSTEYSNTTSIDPDNYDLSNVLTTVPTNKFTIQRIILFSSNVTRIQYGQNIYNSLADAKANIEKEDFVIEPNMEQNGLLRGFIITQEGTTDLSIVATTDFISADRFGVTTGAGGGSVTDLQKAYENSLNPEIITNATLGAVQYRIGSGSDTDNLIVFEGTSGNTVGYITGEGNSSFNNVSITGNINDTLNFNISGSTFFTDTNTNLDIGIDEDVINGDLFKIYFGTSYFGIRNTGSTNTVESVFFGNDSLGDVLKVTTEGIIIEQEMTSSIYDMGTTSGSTNIDIKNGNIQKLVLDGDLTLNALSASTVNGGFLTLYVSQNGVGGYTLTKGTNILTESGAAISITSGASTTDTLTFKTDNNGDYRLDNHTKDFS